MEICNNHEIVYLSKKCPLCEVEEEMEELKDEIGELRKEIEQLELNGGEK